MSPKGTLFVGLILVLFFQAPCSFAQDYRSCLDCHQGIETMDDNHAFPCQLTRSSGDRVPTAGRQDTRPS